MLRFHKIFNGKRRIPEVEMRAAMVSGGVVALAEKLRDVYGWALRDVEFPANNLWVGASKEVKVSVKVNDLSMFTFAGSTNLSHWLDREELEVEYSMVEDILDYDQAKQRGVKEFALRLLVTQRDHRGVGVWIGASPHTRAELRTRLGDNANSNCTPHITFPLHEVNPYQGSKSGRAAYARFSREEQAGDKFGIAVIPWLEVTAEGEDDAMVPESEDVKESLLRLMRLSTMSATATTPASMEARMRSLEANQATQPKRPAHVFPEYAGVSEGETETSASG